MKILCDKCHKDISSFIYQEFEKNTPKSIICPICKQKQKRYLSEADFQVYIAFIEVCYFILSFITSILLNFLGLNIYFGLIVLILLILSIIITNRFKSFLYTKSFHKKETMYIEQKEDSNKISKSLRWQFILFFALVITFVTEFDEPRLFWPFVFLSFMASCLSIIKSVLATKKEIEIYKKNQH